MAMRMGKRRPDFNWEGMMNWWSAHSDGTHSPVSDEENLKHMEYNSDEDDAAVAFDVVQRVHRIGDCFIDGDDDNDTDVYGNRVPRKEEEVDEISSDDRVAVLVELHELAEYVDITEEFHSGNYLAPFFQKVLCYTCDAGIFNKHAAVRAKAAEIVTTMVHNNPISQQLVMEVNGLKTLLDNFISDPDVTARTNALVAISSLIRNNKPGITAFLLDNGYAAALRDALSSESVRLQRETLNLIQYLLHENSSDCNIVIELGLQEADIMVHLTSSDAAEVREAALRCLLVLARDESGHIGQLVKNDDKLKQVLRERIEGIRAMAPEDLGDAREEIQLVDSLWNACYNQPSSLGEKGLLVLPEFHSGNYLAPFFQKVLCYTCDAGIFNKHAAVRAKAAEIVTTMVHNNPISQQLVMEVNGLKTLLDNFISDPDVTARTNALVAISSLIRNNKPGITAFLLYNGYAALRDALSSESVTLQRETLNLIQYLLHEKKVHENSSDCNIVIELGLQEADIMVHLTSSDDAEVREAALRCLLVLARDESGHNGQLVKNDDKLKQVLRERIEGISVMAPEDLGAAMGEIQLVDSLWNACYNEPSSLGDREGSTCVTWLLTT